MSIVIPDEKLRDLVRAVYDMSVPVGLGFLHATEGSLSDEDVNRLIHAEGRIAVKMDYVKGRQCKMTVFRAADGTLTIHDQWFDHSDRQLEKLLELLGVTA